MFCVVSNMTKLVFRYFLEAYCCDSNVLGIFVLNRLYTLANMFIYPIGTTNAVPTSAGKLYNDNHLVYRIIAEMWKNERRYLLYD